MLNLVATDDDGRGAPNAGFVPADGVLLEASTPYFLVVTSYGSFDGDPYIMMNYKPAVLRDVFTLAHEAGHSMHTYFSVAHQPYEYHHYTIFVAEVASTFNEQLLTQHLLENAQDDRERAYLINNEIDDIRATIVRQTMFAEFEKITHEMVESGEPLTVAALKSTYQQLLRDYFGPEFVIDDQLSLECLRIPHFYRAFYVYKYATGLSAAIALSQRVLQGGDKELDAYLGFLKGGCSKFPSYLPEDISSIARSRACNAESALRSSRHNTPRDRVGYVGLIRRRLEMPTKRPFWLTPSQVPPAWASTPHKIRGFPDWMDGD